MAKNNPRAAKVSVYGDWGSAEDIIYSDWEVSDFDIASLKTRTDVKFLYGLDFGYATSYNAFIAVAIEPLTHTMWVFDEMYERGMTNLDIAKRLTEKGYAKEIVTADAAEPKSIYELQQGFIEEVMDNGEKVNVRYSMPNIRAAIKGPDSVNNGIARVQEYHIYVHHTCKNTIVELNNYAWSKDKDGRLTNKPEKEYDHLMDALRYSLSMELLKGRAGIVEARGEDRPSRVASSIRDVEPINTFRNSKVLNITGPTDVAPPKKKRRWVFSSIPDDATDRDPSGKGFFR